MRYKFFCLLVLLLLSLDAVAAVTRGATVSTNMDSADPVTDATISHTVDSGTTLLVISVCTKAESSVSGTPQWSLGGGENLTLIDATTSSGLTGDQATEVWGLVSPTSGSGSVSITIGSTDNVGVTAVNYIGTVTSSVGDATNFLSEDVNDSATTTSVHASAGTSGNALYLSGCFRGEDGNPTSNNASFNEVVETITGTENNTNDSSIYIADLLDAAPSAITATWSADDENASTYIEIVAAAAATSKHFYHLRHNSE